MKIKINDFVSFNNKMVIEYGLGWLTPNFQYQVIKLDETSKEILIRVGVGQYNTGWVNCKWVTNIHKNNHRISFHPMNKPED